MTKISNLYSLTNYITANSSGNVVIAAPTSGSALYVTGAGTVTGQLTLGSTITNGTNTYTLPSATGTLALTSQIPSVTGFVPYSGATSAVNLGIYALFTSGTYITKVGTSSGAIFFEHGSSGTLAPSGYSAIGITGTDGIVMSFNGSSNTITFKNNLLSAAQIYSLPNASGTIALTSNLSSYLPLSGGTLTGALSGTSASFSSSITTNGTTLSSWGNVVIPALETINGNSISSYNASNIPAFYLASNAYHNGTSYIRKTANSAMLVSIDGYNNNFQIQSAASSTAGSTISWTQRFNIDGSNGAATFSSSVTATQLITKSASGAAALFLKDGSGVDKWEIGHISNALYFYNYTAGNNSMYINSSGNVGIGTTSPARNLDVVGTGRFSNDLTVSNSFRLFLNGSTGQDWALRTNSSTANFEIVDWGSTVARVSITPAGNVGIGTTAPGDSRLMVSGTHPSGNAILRVQAVTDDTASIGLFGTAQTRKAMLYYSASQVVLETASDPLLLNTNGTERMRITSGGNVLIGDTADYLATKLYIKSAGATSSTNILACLNSSGTDYFRVRSDGYTYAKGVYDNTTGSGANVFVGSGGDFLRSTSSIKYKKNVLDYSKGLSEIMQMRAVTYEGKSKADEGKIFAGLIAEEVHDLGLTEFVQYAEDGTPDALAYQNMVSLLIKGIQELKAELDIFKNK